jgi:hypothetical protein
MKLLPIRFKLTAWYAAILLASLSIFGVAAFFAMTKGIEKSVDENLEGQAAGIEELMGRVLNEEPTHLRDELREHAELREQADFSQVCDEGGHWIYRSRLMASHNVPAPATASYSAYNVQAGDLPLRVMVREIKAGGDRYPGRGPHRAHGVALPARLAQFCHRRDDNSVCIIDRRRSAMGSRPDDQHDDSRRLGSRSRNLGR